MLDNRKLINDFLSKVKGDLVKDLHSKKLSKGDLNMKTETEQGFGMLTGNDYYYYLVHGRKPGRFPNIENILDWIHSKGIHPQPVQNKDGSFSMISERSLTFLIGRKIAEQGTDIYTGKRPGLALEEIVDKNNKEFKGVVTAAYLKDFKEIFSKSLKEIFAK